MGMHQNRFQESQQQQSPNLAATTLTVAERRALFEKNIAAQQQIKIVKPTIVTTMRRCPPSDSVVVRRIPAEWHRFPTVVHRPNMIITPPRPVQSNQLSPPSRRGTRPRESPAAAALRQSSPTTQNAPTPPRIRNVLLKRKLVEELNDDTITMPDSDTTGTTVATSSPINNIMISPAGMILLLYMESMIYYN